MGTVGEHARCDPSVYLEIEFEVETFKSFRALVRPGRNPLFEKDGLLISLASLRRALATRRAPRPY